MGVDGWKWQIDQLEKDGDNGISNMVGMYIKHAV